MQLLNYYQQIQPLNRFTDITNPEYYRSVPDDWQVIITDVRSSTKAIESGGYKNVNLVGIAGLVVVKNALNLQDFPFVFGGDGVTMLLPLELSQIALRKLRPLPNFVSQNFQLGLRIGIVPVSLIRQNGADIQLAKVRLAGKQSLAMFRGGGLALADQMIKSSPEFDISPNSPTALDSQEIDFSGLSCRWNPIPSRHGKILSLMVKQWKADESIYDQILHRFYEIFGDNLRAAHPVTLDNMNYPPLSELWRQERRFFSSLWDYKFLRRMISNLISGPLYRWPTSLFRKLYTDSMAIHSDFRKFDDCLRMVLDCSETQVQALESYLSELRQAQKIYYGIHPSKHALMTCFVPSIQEGEHIHFIDGDEGGYTIAAKQMKSQIKASK